jgi:hypothetical protein
MPIIILRKYQQLIYISTLIRTHHSHEASHHVLRRTVCVHRDIRYVEISPRDMRRLRTYAQDLEVYVLNIRHVTGTLRQRL